MVLKFAEDWKLRENIIVKKEHDGYKLVKVIGKAQELDNVDDLEKKIQEYEKNQTEENFENEN